MRSRSFQQSPPDNNGTRDRTAIPTPRRKPTRFAGSIIPSVKPVNQRKSEGAEKVTHGRRRRGMRSVSARWGGQMSTRRSSALTFTIIKYIRIGLRLVHFGQSWTDKSSIAFAVVRRLKLLNKNQPISVVHVNGKLGRAGRAACFIWSCGH